MNKILLMSSTFFSCQSDQLLLKTYIKSKQLKVTIKSYFTSHDSSFSICSMAPHDPGLLLL